MPEHLPHGPENTGEHQPNVEQAEVVKPQETTPAAPEHDQLAQSLEALRERVETHAKSAEEVRPDTPETESQHYTGLGLQRALKAEAYEHTLQKTRSHLSAPAKVFSKVVHQPVIDNISNVAAKTIARPSGLFLGSFFALTGSAVLLYMTKHYGFRYNYAIFFALFAGGLLLGLLIEALYRFALRRRSE